MTEHRSPWRRAQWLAFASCLATACSSGSKAAPSAATSASTKPSATASAAAMPKPSSTANLALHCDDDAFHHEAPEFCLTPQISGQPGAPKPDGEWMSIEIGRMATVSYAKMPLDAALKDIRKVWGDESLKPKTHYEEKQDGAKTVIRYKSYDPEEDRDAKETIDVVVVFAKSGDFAVRCEIDGGMTEEKVCLDLVLPP
jgi:hypothetical protein